VIVVGDTSPLRYLLVLERVELLPTLFQRVVAPRVVIDEMLAVATPEIARKWAAQPPDWLEIHEESPAFKGCSRSWMLVSVLRFNWQSGWMPIFC
jgi:predicted nucleic acid-binding protein